MSTELEKYLKEQRAALDVETPEDILIWEGIRSAPSGQEGPGRKRVLWLRARNIAAMVVLVLSVGYVLADLILEHRPGRGISLADIDGSLGDKENEYRTLVSFKEAEANTFSRVDNLIIAELLEEIEKLDMIYEQAMRDLEELGNNERVIATIFDIYEKKIYLLELIILENNKIKNHEREENLYL